MDSYKMLTASVFGGLVTVLFVVLTPWFVLLWWVIAGAIHWYVTAIIKFIRGSDFNGMVTFSDLYHRWMKHGPYKVQFLIFTIVVWYTLFALLDTYKRTTPTRKFTE